MACVGVGCVVVVDPALLPTVLKRTALGVSSAVC